MTKLEIVVAMAAAKLQRNGYVGDADLKDMEALADKILNLWPVAAENDKNG